MVHVWIAAGLATLPWKGQGEEETHSTIFSGKLWSFLIWNSGILAADLAKIDEWVNGSKQVKGKWWSSKRKVWHMGGCVLKEGKIA